MTEDNTQEILTITLFDTTGVSYISDFMISGPNPENQAIADLLCVAAFGANMKGWEPEDVLELLEKQLVLTKEILGA